MSTRKNYELQIWWSLDGQDCLNVFHYHQPFSIVTSHYAQKLFFGVQVSMTPALLDCVSSDCHTVRMYAFDVDDEIGDHFGAPFVHSGTRPSGHLPKFFAWGLKKHRTSRAIHNGWFRLPGISQSDLHGRVPTSTILTKLGIFSFIVCEDVINTGFIGQLSIYSKSTPTHPVRTMYRVVKVDYSRVTTQNTRKR